MAFEVLNFRRLLLRMGTDGDYCMTTDHK